MRDDRPPAGPRVSAAEDALLRRLDLFRRSGAVLAPDLDRLVRTIRSRDERAGVRPPFDFVTAAAVGPPVAVG